MPPFRPAIRVPTIVALFIPSKPIAIPSPMLAVQRLTSTIAKGGTRDDILYRVDIHARQQTLSYLDTEDGTMEQRELHHERDDIESFYNWSRAEVIIGIEACGYSNWFEELIKELGHKTFSRRNMPSRRRCERLLGVVVSANSLLLDYSHLCRHRLPAIIPLDIHSCIALLKVECAIVASLGPGQAPCYDCRILKHA